MDHTTVGFVGIALMIAIFLTRMPVAYVMILVGFAGFSTLISLKGGLVLLSREIYQVFSSYGLTTIPLFVLMGQIAFHSGISRRLYDTGYTFFGGTRGGLAMATVSACTAFGAICGSSPATAATMATIGLPEMKRYGYSDELATGAVASGGGLGMIMPPSVVLIVYGILTEQSIGELFVAGIVPAILVTILFIGSIHIRCAISPYLGPPGERAPWSARIKSLLGLTETVVVFLLVIGGIFFGIFTPTEAAAVGSFIILVISMARRKITWRGFLNSLFETLRTSCMVLFLIAGATVFGKFLAVTRIPFDIASWVGHLHLPPFLVMMVIVFIYFVGGCFMDALAFVMLTVPVFFPVVQSIGYDPVWFGIMIVMVTEMGVITPPVGINVYVVYGVAQGVLEHVTLESIFRGILPFLFAVALGIVILLAFPQLILFLPELMYTH